MELELERKVWKKDMIWIYAVSSGIGEAL